jgi:hypothetical protein
MRIEFSTTSFDSFLGAPCVTSIRRRVKVATIPDLNGFRRVSADTLVNLASRDLWGIRRDGGDLYIERLFQDNGSPLKESNA